MSRRHFHCLSYAKGTGFDVRFVDNFATIQHDGLCDRRLPATSTPGCKIPLASAIPTYGAEALTNEAIVFAVCADPKPADSGRNLHAKGAISESDAHGAKASDRFEVKRRVLRVRRQQREVPVREVPHLGRQCPVRRPEVARCKVIQRGVVRPASCSRSARSASPSRRPPATSASSLRSQFAASNSVNQTRSCCNSSADNALISFSIFSTFPKIRFLRARGILRRDRPIRATGTGCRNDR